MTPPLLNQKIYWALSLRSEGSYLSDWSNDEKIPEKSRPHCSSFSMRSTWVINIRRQQYRLHPSWVIISLGTNVSSLGKESGRRGHALPHSLPATLVPFEDNVPKDLRLPWAIIRKTYQKSACHLDLTLPQEKHRTGMIILPATQV